MLEILANKEWLLEEGYLQRMAGIFADRLRLGHSLEGLIKPQTLENYAPRIDALAADSGVRMERLQINADQSLPVANVSGTRIALIPVIGPLMKYSGMCNVGMQTYQKWMGIANAAPEINGIMLLMDTPGGSVDGTPEFGHAVKNSLKPVGVFGDGMVASAGMWIASQAKVIVGNKNNPTSFGSIGTLMVHEDFSKMEEAGRAQKVEIIRAPQSTEKALVNSIEPLTEDLRAQVKDHLREITNDFIGTVKAGRGAVLDAKAEGLFAGRMFEAQKAKQIGLIDSVGTLGTALNKLTEIVKEQDKIRTSSPARAQVNNTMKFPKLSNLFSGEAWSKVAAAFSEEEQATLEATEKKVADSEAKLAQLTEENSQLKTGKEEADTKVSSLTATVSEQAAQITSLTAEKATLETEKKELQTKLAAKPTGQATTIISNDEKEDAVTADQGASATTENKYLTSVDAQAKQIREENVKNSTFK